MEMSSFCFVEITASFVVRTLTVLVDWALKPVILVDWALKPVILAGWALKPVVCLLYEHDSCCYCSVVL